ncbi:SMI1/KNR4 family protein [Streptomyces canus]|uniref:SMI1/KNR4 family protein n=1 Tax=Streptomyces canus TaxID=58343 RepID=UPI00386B052A|nr:SMI1/KNR4 family protein [Streptomyces canus]
MADTTFDWRSFLARWSEEWADAAGSEDLSEADEEARRERWLGFAPASQERIAALEERLVHRLPPSYRAFLEVSDGWRHAGGFVWLLGGTEQARWHEDAIGMAEVYREDLDENPAEEQVLLAGMWERALQVDAESDITYVLLDPGDVREDGEWAVYYYRGWAGESPDRYASFREFMEAMYQSFHSLTAHRLGPEFANATTRALDASVEEARLEALRGRYDRAETALAQAMAYGRPRATALRDQIRRLLGHTYMVYFHGIAADPGYAQEVLPALAAEDLRMGRGVGSSAPHLRVAPDAVRKAGEDTLRQVADGTFRYSAPGPFGRAVAEAREQARWGETDAAWRTLRAAFPDWRPVGPDHIVPLGLLGDPLLAPLFTPERGRELLATARADETGDLPQPTADLDPAGLAWLADDDPGNALSAYRFVLVEGVPPTELPARIGVDETTTLHHPMTLWEAPRRLRAGQQEVPDWGDRALTAVGRAGPQWSFAFEPRPNRFHEQRFVSPAGAASRGTRALVVWSDPPRSHNHYPGLFHVSMAEDGQEQYAFTVHGTTIRRSGTAPAALAPDRLFPRTEPLSGRLGERRVLEALTAEFGVRLPRFALTQGRLHTFTTCSWTRPPGPGETYAVIRMGPLSP